MDLTDKYNQLLAKLLPPGPAWSKDDPLLKGLSPALARIEQRANDLLLEIDSSSVNELIDRYETISGLPDSCTPPGTQTLTERRQRLDSKINAIGGIHAPFYLRQLEQLGYENASIGQYECPEFTCESACTAALYDASWRYLWTVYMPTGADISEMTCNDDCSSSLRAWGDGVAECVINKLTPSHTIVNFAYQG